MPNFHNLRVAVLLLPVVSAVLAPVCAADIWAEQGDAPALIPGQSTLSLDTISAITGNISGLDDTDLYEISISNPSIFSATVVSGPTYVNPGLDTLLWLFNSQGQGVYANDDKGPSSTFPGGYDYTSELSAGNPNGPPTPGIYYLAISAYHYAPVDVNGSEIFGNTYSDTGGGLGPTSLSNLAGWQATDSDASPAFEQGNYTIELTGVGPVPEPETLALVATAAAWMVVLSTLKRLRRERLPNIAAT
jgi:hypothetical protein